ncbi:MAG TPA: zinc ribbon domain-containing protein, partial [Atopobiaceae bacterium]|nr:zinc ribbon domain-containing protein [Atopobiaceae bacterium]
IWHTIPNLGKVVPWHSILHEMKGIPMARYDYICTSCNHIFEIEHPMDVHPDVSCPVCGAPSQRHFASSSIVFKGSGFYNTDQRGNEGASATGEHEHHSCENCPHKIA